MSHGCDWPGCGLGAQAYVKVRFSGEDKTRTWLCCRGHAWLLGGGVVGRASAEQVTIGGVR